MKTSPLICWIPGLFSNVSKNFGILNYQLLVVSSARFKNCIENYTMKTNNQFAFNTVHTNQRVIKTDISVVVAVE